MAKQGGARVGSGRKPRALAVVAREGPVVGPPAGLSEAAAGWWATWAPLAHGVGTLTKETGPAFALLCESQATLVHYSEVVRADGETFFKVTVDGSGQEQRELKAHPLIAKAQAAAYRVEQLLARFCLAPTGRPIQAAPSTSASKWAPFGVGAAS